MKTLFLFKIIALTTLPTVLLTAPGDSNNAGGIKLVPPPDASVTGACSSQDCLFWQQDANWTDDSELDGGEAFAFYRVVNPQGDRFVSNPVKVISGYRFPAICLKIQFRFTGDRSSKLTVTYRQITDQQNGYVDERVNGVQVWQANNSKIGNNNNNRTWQSETIQISRPPPEIRIYVEASSRGQATVDISQLDVYAVACFKRAGDSFEPYMPRNDTTYLNQGEQDTNYWQDGVVPYEFAPGFETEQREKLINLFTNVSLRVPCVHFVRRGDQNAYVRFERSEANCDADVGFKGGKQMARMTDSCFLDGMPGHLILHILGMRHEHLRKDRDRFVTVNMDNVDPSQRGQFTIRRWVDDRVMNISYDTKSILHAASTDFAKAPGLKTMVAKSNPREDLSNRDGPTELDYRKLASIYGCSLQPSNPVTGNVAQEEDPSDRTPCRQILVVAPNRYTIRNYRRRSDGKYRANEFCGWLVTVTPRQWVQFTIQNIDIENSPNCAHDALEFYEGTEPLPTRRRGPRFCGSALPKLPSIVINASTALVVFRTDSSVNEGVGFGVSFTEIPPSRPVTQNVDSDPTFCDFDKNSCQWKNSTSLRWRLGKQSAIGRDHSNNNGMYLLLDANNRTLINKDVTFTSQSTFSHLLERYPKLCFQFWFRFADRNRIDQTTSNVGVLKLIAEAEGDAALIWSSNEDQDEEESAYREWTKIEVGLSSDDFNNDASGDGYFLKFIGHLDKFTQGGIAIDDTQILTSSCEGFDPEPTTTEAPKTTTKTTRPTTRTIRRTSTTLLPAPVIETVFCNFEQGNLCDGSFDFEPPLGSRFMWQVVRGRSARSSGSAAPHTDRSTGLERGRYALASANGQSRGSVAIIDSGEFDSADYTCLGFSYYMNGDPVAQLNVKLMTATTNRVLAMLRGNRGENWADVMFRINYSPPRKFSIRFAATMGGTPLSDIAIDDIRLFKSDRCVLTSNMVA